MGNRGNFCNGIYPQYWDTLTPYCTVESRYLDLTSRITAYLEVKILSLPKHEKLTTGEKYCGKEEKLRAISPLFHNILPISLTSRVQLHINLLNVVV